MSKTVDDAAQIADDLKPVITDDGDKDPSIPEGFSADEWCDLSDEEREGILSQDDEIATGGGETDVDMDILAKVAGEGETPSADDDKGKGSAADTGTEDKGAVGGDDGVKPDLTAFEVVDDGGSPKLPAIPLEVSNDVPADLKAKIDELAERFDVGEMSVREYADQRDALNREVWQRNLQAAQEAQAAKAWEAEQAHFLAKNPAYTEDSLRGNALFGMLDAAVRTLAADPANADKSGYQILQMAHKEVVGIVKGAANAPKETPSSVPATGAKPKAAKPDIATLGDVPASAANVGEDPFSAIDRLDGEAYEAALERMTPDQLKSYRARL